MCGSSLQSPYNAKTAAALSDRSFSLSLFVFQSGQTSVLAIFIWSAGMASFAASNTADELSGSHDCRISHVRKFVPANALMRRHFPSRNSFTRAITPSSEANPRAFRFAAHLALKHLHRVDSGID